MQNSLSIRPARAADGPAVFPWTRTTFSWGDYISEVWERWVQDPHGQLLVAEIGGRVVGTLHVGLLGNREGWMEGMRVHPDFRQHGIATALDLAGQSVARRAGCRLVRLETAATNIPAQAAIVTYGYRRLFAVLGYDTPALDGEPAHTRLATYRDARALLRLWEHSWLRRAFHNLVSLREGWRWAALTPARLRDYIAHDCIYVTPAVGGPRGWAIVRRDDDDFGIHLLIGRAPTRQHLLADLRVHAHRAGLRELYLFLPESARASAYARSLGLTPHDHSMLLYECPLTKS